MVMKELYGTSNLLDTVNLYAGGTHLTAALVG
jgi:hypothetical protein